MSKELDEALEFYDLNDYLQPFQCDLVVDALRSLSAEVKHLKSQLDESG